MYGYDEIVKHLQNDCDAKRIYLCPNYCHIVNRSNQKMDHDGLRTHLLDECPYTIMECAECGQEQERQNCYKHTERDCLRLLRKKHDQQEMELKALRLDKQRNFGNFPSHSPIYPQNNYYTPAYTPSMNYNPAASYPVSHISPTGRTQSRSPQYQPGMYST